MQLSTRDWTTKSHVSCRQGNVRLGRHAGQQAGGMMMGSMDKVIWGKFMRPAFLFGVLAVLLSVAAAHASGQTIKDLPPPPPVPKPKATPTPKPTPEEVLDVVRVSSNLVMVPVSVTDSKGQAVQGLQVKDFRLEEEGRPQEIAEIGDPEQVPLDIAILFDISSSVSQKDFFAFQQEAAAAFLRLVMKPVDKASIFTIAGEPTLVQPLTSSETAAAKVVTIPAATTPVLTAFYDTVSAAAKYLMDNSPSRHRRVIIVLSDGDDNYSEMIKDVTIAEVRASEKGTLTPAAARVGLQDRHRRAVLDVQQTVQKADVTFYSVNPGGLSVRLNEISMRAESGMQSIADATGGTAFVPNSDKDLEVVFRQVAAELRGQYLIQYYANTESQPGQFRRITVSVPARIELRVRARQGYYPRQNAAGPKTKVEKKQTP
jgi:Ca-activated chloride channel family protein